MGLLDLDQDGDERTWGRYPRAAWDMPSVAVVACDGHGHGCVLYTGGPAVASELAEVSRELADIGLDDAPAGISVWFGRLRAWPGSWEHPNDTDSELVGEFRQPTDAEWCAIRRGESPWDEREWGLEPEPESKP